MKHLFAIYLIAVAGVFAITAADADETDDTALIIEAQPLASALREFSEQTGLQIGYAAELVEGKETRGVEGIEEPDLVLDALLANSGLEHRFVNEETVVIRQETSDSEVEVSSDSGNLQSTSRRVAMAQAQRSAHEEQAVRNSSTASESDEEGKPREIEEIVITGSRIRGAQSASPIIAITHEDIDRAGFATTEQIVAALPQNFSGGAGQENYSDWFNPNSTGDFTGSGVSIDLRGLGPDSTLVLLNGRRLSNSGFRGAFVDLSSIPVTAIERVEVLTDGASAIYGADALAGVVNFILKDNYDGAETVLRYGPDVGADTSDIRLGQVFGKSWQKGNLLFTYEYYHQDNLDTSKRAFAASSDLRPLGGDDWSPVGGNPGTIIAGSETYAIPAGQDGTALTPADFAGLEGTVSRRNRREAQDLLGDQERHSVMLLLRRDISENMEYFLETRYSKREATTRTFQSGIELTVPDTNPFFVDPTGTGLTSVTIDNYSIVRDIGPSYSDGDVESIGASTGVSFDLGANYRAEFSGSYTREKAKNRFRNHLNRPAARAAAAGTTVETALNPFGDGSNTDPALLDELRADGAGNDVEQDLWSLHFDLDGRLFELPSGTVSLATGLEYRNETLENASIEFPALVIPGADRERRMVAAYAEILFPLVEPAEERAGLHRLELSLAGRYEDYDDFGDSTNPKLGLLWSPFRSLNIRATIGTSFKPPLLTQLDTSPGFFNFNTWASWTPDPLMIQFGGNAELSPEEATTWTAGIQLAPEKIPGLQVDLTYFSIDMDDRVRRAVPSEFVALNPEFASFVNTMPTQDEIIALATSPLYQNFGGATPQDFIDGLVPVTAIVDMRLQNVAKAEVSGLDVHADYSFESAAGQFDLGLNGSYLFHIKDTLLPTDPTIDRVSTVNNPVDLRLRGNLSWSRGGWGAAAFVNYTDSYTNDEMSLIGGPTQRPEEDIDSWRTVDVQLSYNTEGRISNSWLSDVRLSLTIQNVFDEDPPFVNLSRGIGYDPRNANALGQYVVFQVAKTWDPW